MQAPPVTLYYNAKVLTMDPNNRELSAVAISNGKIIEVGSLLYVCASLKRQFKPSQISLINLQSKTVLPGFYDAHSHIFLYSLHEGLTAQLDSPPMGKVLNIHHIQEILRKEVTPNSPGKLIFGMGYNDLGLEESRHPNRYELDEVSKEQPIVILHYSNHSATVNSLIIHEQNIKQALGNPALKKFIDVDEQGEPTGVLRESAMVLVGPYLTTYFTKDKLIRDLYSGIEQYKAHGIKTIQEGVLMPPLDSLFSQGLRKEKTGIDIRGYTLIGKVGEKLKYTEPSPSGYKTQTRPRE